MSHSPKRKEKPSKNPSPYNVPQVGQLPPLDLGHNNVAAYSSSLRTRFIEVPKRLVNRSGRLVLRTPAPWAKAFICALDLLAGPSPVPI